MSPRPAVEMVTVDLPRGEFRALVVSAKQVADLMSVVGDTDGAVMVSYIAAKVVTQIDPEYAEAHPLPAYVVETAERLLAEDAERHG